MFSPTLQYPTSEPATDPGTGATYGAAGSASNLPARSGVGGLDYLNAECGARSAECGETSNIEHSTSNVEGADLAVSPSRRLADSAPASFEHVAAAVKRLEAIEMFHACLATGATRQQAARAVGLGYVTLWRSLDELRRRGLRWNAPEHREMVLEALAPETGNCGRSSKWEFILKDLAACAKLDLIYCATTGASSDYLTDSRRTGKVATTLLRFAEEPECPAPLAALLQRGGQPAPLVRHLRRITPEMEARLRGEKHFQLHGLTSRRDMTARLPDGKRAKLPAGFMVEFDDMSANEPFWVDAPAGPILSRQGLYARDVASGRWLGVELVARPREAYRAEDILRFFRKLMATFGKFRVLRLERGTWASRCIKGYRITESGEVEAEEFERPAMDEAEKAKLQDGLRAIGITVHYVHSAHGKGGIESSFNYFQTILATYTTEYLNIGRHAGEFECGAKRMRQARAGRHPSELGFAHIDTLADRIEKAFVFINRKPLGRTGRTPDAVWAEDVARHELPALTERDLAAFLPDMREAMIQGGAVIITIEGREHLFRAEAFTRLGDAYRVYARLDPTEPTLGAAIYNRETSSANHLGFRAGEYVCYARWEMPGPQIELESAPGLEAQTVEELYGAGAVDEKLARRNAQEKFVRTAYRALPRPGKPAIRSAEVRDGAGAVAAVGDRLEAIGVIGAEGETAKRGAGDTANRRARPRDAMQELLDA